MDLQLVPGIPCLISILPVAGDGQHARADPRPRGAGRPAARGPDAAASRARAPAALPRRASAPPPHFPSRQSLAPGVAVTLAWRDGNVF